MLAVYCQFSILNITIFLWLGFKFYKLIVEQKTINLLFDEVAVI